MEEEIVMDHEEYLKLMIKDKTLKLDELHVNHQIHIAVFETKRDMLIDEINSIEEQLRHDGK
jgi:hypothetical protein